MGVKIDLTGKKFGYLTVLKESDIAGQWVCECECGAIVIKKGEYLRNGDTKSCGGAIHRGKQLQGQRFGYLTVIEHVGYRNKEKLWRCLCDCGNYTEVRGGSLTSGRTKSCGCYNKQLSKERLSKINPYKDLSNQTFGLLTPIKIYDSDKRGEKRWLCQCSCGNTCIVLGSNLRTGHTQSCGCLRISHGELSIKNLLESNNIKFIMEKTFDSCRFQDSGCLAKFDFFVNDEYLIEFDGEVHYSSNLHGWHTETRLKDIQKRDLFKNKWCADNNIPLIRIPYSHLDKIKIEDLLLNTTTFLVNNKE